MRANQPIGDSGFRTLVEKALDGIVLVDADGVISYCSPAIKAMLGYEEDELIGSSLSEVVHPDDRHTAIDMHNPSIQNPSSTASDEVRIKHNDGSWHYFEAIATNHLHDPKLQAFVVNLRDISERKQTVQEINSKLAFYQRLTEQNPDLLLVLSSDGTILYRSPYAEQQLDFKPGELQDKIGFDFVHPDDVSWLLEAYAEVVKTPGSTVTVGARVRHPDGTWHHAEASALNRLDDPAVGGVIVAIRDITERKNMENSLRDSEKQLRETAHKLRIALEEVSTPVVQVWDSILALPLVGVLDDQRAQAVMEVLLAKIVETQSELIIVDVTGVPSLDTHTLNYLMRTVQATSMLGARCVLTGMQPEFAQSVTKLDLDLSKVVIKRDLQDGLKWALAQSGQEG